MLNMVIKNVRRMKKHYLISETTFNKFQLQDKFTNPHQSEELTEYVKALKKANIVIGAKEYLSFNSHIEGGNLERAEAYPLNFKLVMRQRMANEIVN